MENRVTGALQTIPQNIITWLVAMLFYCSSIKRLCVPCRMFLGRGVLIGLSDSITTLTRETSLSYLLYTSPNFLRTCSIIDSYYLRVGDYMMMSIVFLSHLT